MIFCKVFAFFFSHPSGHLLLIWFLWAFLFISAIFKMLTFFPTIASLAFFMSCAGFLLNCFTFFLICDTWFTRTFSTVFLKSLWVSLGFLPFWLLFLSFYCFCGFYVFPLLEIEYLCDVFVWLTPSHYSINFSYIVKLLQSSSPISTSWNRSCAALETKPREASFLVGPRAHLPKKQSATVSKNFISLSHLDEALCLAVHS